MARRNNKKPAEPTSPRGELHDDLQHEDEFNPFNMVLREPDGPGYQTRHPLEVIASEGIRNAASDTMREMGYVVVAQDGWIVKRFANGSTVRLEEIESVDVDLMLD